MSYNGIGLSSAKGSSTSGFIQRNVADAKSQRNKESQGKHYYKRQLDQKRQAKIEKIKRSSGLPVDREILDHESRREAEIEVMKYRDRVEEENPELSDGEIDTMVDAFRVAQRTKVARRKATKPVPYNATVNPFTKKAARGPSSANMPPAAALTEDSTGCSSGGSGIKTSPADGEGSSTTTSPADGEGRSAKMSPADGEGLSAKTSAVASVTHSNIDEATDSEHVISGSAGTEEKR